jgi:hypothetical protein
MCGIHGYIGSVPFAADKPSGAHVRDVVRDGFITGMVRGVHSAGLFAVPKNQEKEIPFLKRAYNGLDFVNAAPVKDLLSDFALMNGYVGHVRWATKGDVHRDNAHPFQHGPITMVHNGTILNERSLGDWGYGTDSEYICRSLAERPDPRDTIKLLNGPFVLVWHDRRTNKMYMTRNKERELAYSYVKDRNLLLFASEWPMLQWLAWRNYIELEDIESVTPYDILEFPVDEPRGRVIIKAEEYKPPAPLYPQHHHSGGATGNGNFIRKALSIVQTSTSGGNGSDVPANVKEGRIIEFAVTDVYLNKNVSRTGVIEGVMVDAPGWRVVCRAVDMRKFSGGKLLLGKVASYVCLGSSWPTVYVAFVNESQNPDVLKDGTPGTYKKHYKKYKEVEQNPILQPDYAVKKPKPIILDSEMDPDDVWVEVQNESLKCLNDEEYPGWHRMVTLDGRLYSVAAASAILEKDKCAWCGDPFQNLKDIKHVDMDHVCGHNCADAIPFLKMGSVDTAKTH